MQLPFADGAFDAATVGFGARNFDDLERGLAEMARVVRPGGRVVVLEITTPTRPPLSLFYRLWFDRIVPALGHAAALLARERRGLASPTPTSTCRTRSAASPAHASSPASSPRQASSKSDGLTTAGGIVAIHHGTVAGPA